MTSIGILCSSVSFLFSASLNPCVFEFVYLARPDSVIDGASVYATRLKMGEYLAEKIRRELPEGVLPDILAGEWNRAMKNLHSQKA